MLMRYKEGLALRGELVRPALFHSRRPHWVSSCVLLDSSEQTQELMGVTVLSHLRAFQRACHASCTECLLCGSY